MVAIFTGAGTGFERGSGSVLGSSGLLGSGTVGRSGEQLFLNAANGNLLISQQDEFLAGRGPDASIGRTYNSLGNQSDDNGDNWRQSTQRAVSLSSGTINSWGSTLTYRGGDGSEITYSWNGSAYVTTDGAGAYDKITWNGSIYSRTDGDSGTVETFESDGATAWYRLKAVTDTSGNGLTYDYSGGKLANAWTSNGERISYTWLGNHIEEISRVFYEDGTWKTQVTTRYGYDAYDRLVSVSVDLTPEDNSTTDNNRYVTQYTYYGTTDRIATISETDGSSVSVVYDASGRVTQLSQTVGGGAAARVTNIEYGVGYTIVTDPLGVQTRFDYASGDRSGDIGTWGSGNLATAAGTIDGSAATRFTVQSTGVWAGISQGYVTAPAGGTVTWIVTLQGVGSSTAQSLGIYSNDAWGLDALSSARIISGRGQIVQEVGGLWNVTGLSTTTGTRIEITRAVTHADQLSFYLYPDRPLGWRAGEGVLTADSKIYESDAAGDLTLMDQAYWSYYDTARQGAGNIQNSAAYQYTIQPNATWPAVYQTLNAGLGDTFTYTVSLMGAGGSTATSVGLYGNITAWGDNSWASARIISGPGTISQEAGGLFNITGLSTTVPTRIQIIRTYDRAEGGGIYTYVDRPLGARVGSALVIAGPLLSRDIATERANQLTQVTTAYGTAQAQTVKFGYDDNGDLISVIDALNQQSTFTYDANGNQLTATDRLGNVVTRTYNAANQGLTETRVGSDKDSAGAYHTIRYVYDSANLLRFTISAEGDVTEYDYNGYGQVWLTQNYRTKYDVSGLGTTTAPSEAQMNSWIGTAEATEISMIQYGYDNRGSLWRTIDYGGSVAPSNAHGGWGYSRTDYVYDSAGRLRQSTVAGQRSQYFSYDGLNRLTGKTDLNGGTTTFAFFDSGTTTTVTVAGGGTQISVYNKAGDLVSFSQAGGYVQSGTESYTYDADGRLRTTHDATGVEIYYFYDLLGRKVAEADEYGYFTEYRYDADNRLIATVHYGTAVNAGTAASLATLSPGNDLATIRPASNGTDVRTWSIYDKEGRVLEAIEGDGSVTAYEYDASGRLVKTIGYANKLSPSQVSGLWASPPISLVLPTGDAKDIVARIFYDKAGRVIGALDGEGFLSRTLYDGAGQKVQEIAYATASNAAYRSSGTLQDLLNTTSTSASDRSARYVYDQQGFLRFTIDVLNHVTEYVYQTDGLIDAYGVVRETIQYAGTLPAVSSYSYASLRNVVATMAGDAANRTSFAVYDDAGRVAYTIDATSAVTGYVYDATGKVIRKTEYANLRATSSIPNKDQMDTWASASSSSDDRITRYYYTAGGKLRFTIDAEGYITRTDYDAEGRLANIVRWDNAVSATDTWTISDADAAQSGASSTTSNYYDDAGRLTVTYDGTGKMRRYYYHANGLLAWDIASEGGQDDSRTYYTYDAAGRKATEEVAWGMLEHAITTYAYDGLGNLIAVGDSNSHTTSFTYDHAGRMLTQTDALSHTTTYGYNAFGEQLTVTNACGFTTYSYYDQAGRVTSVVDALNYTTSTAYTAFGEVASVTRAGATTGFAYDKLGRLRTTTDAMGGVETSWYNASGELIQFQNKLGGITNYTRDRRGLLRYEYVQAAVYDSIGTQTASGYYRNIYEYDARGNVVHQIEAYGLAERRDTWFSYDKANQLTSKWGEAVSVGLSPTTVTPSEAYHYDTRGNLIESIDAAGARTLFYYDDLDRRVAMVTPAGTSGNPQGALTTFVYDGVGNLLSSSSWETLLTLSSLAVGGPPPSTPGGNVRTTINKYDAVDQLIWSRVEHQNIGSWNGSSYVYSTDVTLTSYFDYDAAGNLVHTKSADGAEVYSYYDGLNRKTAQVDAAGYITTWALDGEGNVLTERRYAAQATGFSVSGYTLPTTQGDDRLTEFEYDKTGHRLRESRWVVEAWSLNTSNGQLGVAGGWANIYYSYNALGEVTIKTEATGDHTIYNYDNAGRLILEMRQTFASATGDVNPTVRYYYNGLDQLTTTRQGDYTISGNDWITSNIYDGDGRLVSTVDALGQTRSYYYDAAGRKVGESYTRELGNGGSVGAGTTVVEGISYEYDLAGNVIRQAINTISGGTWTDSSYTRMVYNAFGEITDRGTNGVWQEQFVYDNAGHLVRSNAGDGVWRVYVYDAAGRQTLTIESDGSTDLSGIAQSTAVGLISGGTVTATATLFDGRGQATQAVQMLRRVAVGGGTQNLISSQGYNAFGEVLWQQDALGRRTDYTYNTMGRVLQIQRPTVSVTAENGTVSSIRPTEKMFYDISGRLIGTQDANSVAAGSNLKTTRQLVAGTGYGDGEALVVREWHLDGGIVSNGYDVFGNLTSTTDEIGRTTSMAYNKLGQLTQVTRPATAAGTLVDYYSYDILGNRQGHWNNVVGYAGRERTEYDLMGRVTLQMAFGGDYTNTSYSWYGAMSTSGMGSFGGWVATTSYLNGRSGTEYTDIFGHLAWKSDLGGHITTADYDKLGRMTGRQISGVQGTETSYYTWLNNGQLGSIASTAVGTSAVTSFGGYVAITQSSTYDLVGNKLTEYGTRNGVIIENATSTYDALNRLVTWSEAGDTISITPPASSTYQYDPNSNVMRTSSSFRYLDQNGVAMSFVAVKNDVYRYDPMNRMVQGGDTVMDYDAAGQRIHVTTWSDGLIWTGYRATTPGSGMVVYADDPSEYDWQGYHWVASGKATFSGRVIETYTYNADGQLDQVWVSSEQASANGGPYVEPNGSFGASVKRADYDYDLLGRVTSQTDYEANGTTVAYNRSSIVYNAKGQITSETQTTRQGSVTLVSYIANKYDENTLATYALGTVVSSTSHNYKNGVDGDAADTVTANGFEWWDGAVLSAVAYRPNASDTGTQWNTSYKLTPGGLTDRARITDGRARTISFTLDATGQVLRRDEMPDASTSFGNPHQIWYRFNGREMGKVTNDSVDTAYLASIASRQTASGTGAFRNGANTGGGYAVFGEAYQALTSFSQGSSGGSYEAQGGETLEAIASQLWGDSSLWYRLAEANGLSSSATLAADQRITIPSGVVRNTNTATTFKPYDPAEALGSLSPTNPKPNQKGSKCGSFGAILMVVIAVAVTTLATAGATALLSGQAFGAVLGAMTGGAAVGNVSMAAWAAGGAIGSAVGSAASQGFGVATGLQDQFSWKGVALAGIAGGIGGYIQGVGNTARLAVDAAKATAKAAHVAFTSQMGEAAIREQLGSVGSFFAGAGIGGAVTRGVLSNVATQGIGVATKLQSKFDFTGFAAAGVGSAAISSINTGGFAGKILRNAAGGLANAASRSVLNGTDFGDNVLRALPDIIGQTVGDVAAIALAAPVEVDSSLAGIRASTHVSAASHLGSDDIVVTAPRDKLAAIRREKAKAAQAARDLLLGQMSFNAAIRPARQQGTGLRDRYVQLSRPTYLTRGPTYPMRAPQVTIKNAPTGIRGYIGDVVGAATHYLGELPKESMQGVLSARGNLGAILANEAGLLTNAATSTLAETFKPIFPDKEDIFAAQALADNHSRHPFLLDPNRASSNADERTGLATVLISMMGARGAGGRGAIGAAKEVSIGSGPKLLPGEGSVGTFDDLIRAGSPGDNITPHHIPSRARMELEGVLSGDGIAINMEMPVPGSGGRHRATFTYGTQADIGMTPREALAAGVWDARKVYSADGLYGPQIRSSLQELIQINKADHPTIFRKP